MFLRLSHAVPLALVASLAPSIALADIDAGPAVCRDAQAEYPTGLLPASTATLMVRADGPITVDARTRVSLARIEPDGSRTPLAIEVSASTVTVQVTPLDRLEVGTTIVLSQSICEASPDDAIETTYRIVEEIDAPSTLGTIEVSPIYAANLERGERNRFYYLEMRLVPSEAARERAAFLRIVPYIDELELGHWPLTLDEPTRVHVDCGTSAPRYYYDVFAQGEHTLRYAALDRREMVVAEVSRVHSLSCESPIRVDAYTGRVLESWERDYWDREGPDAAVPIAGDGGFHPVALPSGSGCSVAAMRRGSLVPLALFALALTSFVARRKKSSNRSTL